MDLKEDKSKSMLEEVGDRKKSETLGKMAPSVGNKVEVNGDIGPEEHIKNHSPVETGGADGVREEIGSVSSSEAILLSPAEAKVNGDGVGVGHTAGSLSRTIVSPPIAASEMVASKPTPTKGYGLKKWRRIRRDLNKDGTTGADSAQILKRRLPLVETQKARDEHKQKSDGEDEGEGSVASMESRNARGSPLAVAGGTLDPELGLLVAAGGFSIGMDSENSEDRSSKSSTAASAPRLRHEAVGFGRERGKVKNFGGRGSGNVVQQRGQRGRGGGLDNIKKFRGDQVRIEKENSHSSAESDLRSSNAAFVQRGSMVSNGKQSEKSVNYDGENSDEAQPSEEVRSAYHKENGVIEDLSKEDLDAELLADENVEKSESHQSHPNLDPFVESLVLLEAAQQALESEIEKFGEIEEPGLDDFDDDYEEVEGSSSPSPEADSIQLNQRIEQLQYKLEDALAAVRSRESKVLELEAILNRTELPRKEIENPDPPLLKEKCKEMEFELESLLEKKIETEIEYLIMTRATQSWKVMAEDHIALLEDQKSLAGDQMQLMHKLRDTEVKVTMLTGQMGELEAYCAELVGAEEVLRLQNEVLKSSLCCFVQLVMLVIVFWWFLMQLLPPSNGVVPT
ncbi:WPP domain-interacting protein 1-like [Phoenix dactylifera]|uniref:WPP domain-interacting protein 1-like n=1 Tax=Phoenix dactylifera TaxID=42345 RepID=A0A8B7CSS0_PHODC|nr:WPP domain-interacting protein 1-like [Phoenix dactylifera]XP_008805521.2 WPP domain-interacting protein 1-like [Phoenix dactylifera]XP_038986701.1 WPP domain-interacting protein 1-like [Phoenix dactylifera]